MVRRRQQTGSIQTPPAFPKGLPLGLSFAQFCRVVWNWNGFKLSEKVSYVAS
jgi:hypothetical protein